MITILPETTKDPISLIGRRAGICWGADITDKEKNYKRGLDCIKSGHGRTWEFVNVEMIIEDYSARVIREWYTHIGGSPTRLQASTRYIDYGNFDYITPDTIKDPDHEEYIDHMDDPEYPHIDTITAKEIYENAMSHIQSEIRRLSDLGIPKEDLANLLPLGMTTKVVDKRNLRNLVDMSRQRMCTRAYHEYRKLFGEIISELKKVSNEWVTVCGLLFHPKCEELDYCPETYSCHRYPDECCANCFFFYCGNCISSNGLEFEREVRKTDHCSRWQKR